MIDFNWIRQVMYEYVVETIFQESVYWLLFLSRMILLHTAIPYKKCDKMIVIVQQISSYGQLMLTNRLIMTYHSSAGIRLVGWGN